MDDTVESLQSSIVLKKKKSHSSGLIFLDNIGGKRKRKIMSYLKKIGLEPYSDVEDDGRPVICADVSNHSLESIRLKLSAFLEKLSGTDAGSSAKFSNSTEKSVKDSSDREFTFVKSDDVEELVKAFDLMLNSTNVHRGERKKGSKISCAPPTKDICEKESTGTPVESARKIKIDLTIEKSVQVDPPKKKFWLRVITGLSRRKERTKDEPVADEGRSKNKKREKNVKSKYLNLDVYTQTKSVSSNSQDFSQRCSECTSCSCSCQSKSTDNKNLYRIPVNFSTPIGGSPFYPQPKLIIMPQNIVKSSKLTKRVLQKDLKKSSSDACICASSCNSPVSPTIESYQKKLRKGNLYLKGMKMKHKKKSDHRIVSLKRLRIVKTENNKKIQQNSLDKSPKKSKQYLEEKESDKVKEHKKISKKKAKHSLRRKVKLEKLRKELQILSEKIDNMVVKKIEKVDASVEPENNIKQRCTNDVGVECNESIPKLVERVNASTEVDLICANRDDGNPKKGFRNEIETSSSYININTELLSNIDSFIQIRKNLKNLTGDRGKLNKTKILGKQKKEIGKLKTLINHMKSQIESTLPTSAKNDKSTNEDYHFWFSRPKVVVDK